MAVAAVAPGDLVDRDGGADLAAGLVQGAAYQKQIRMGQRGDLFVDALAALVAGGDKDGCGHFKGEGRLADALRPMQQNGARQAAFGQLAEDGGASVVMATRQLAAFRGGE